MKGIIIYQSNYGSTREYAQWIGEETGYNIMELKKVKKEDLLNHQIIILGAPIFAGRPLNRGWIIKKWKMLRDKRVILFTTSGAKGDDPVLQKNYESSFESPIGKTMKYFPLGGRMKHDELSFLHSFLMKLGKKMEKDPEIRKEMGRDSDFVNREDIVPLIKYIQQ